MIRRLLPIVFIAAISFNHFHCVCYAAVAAAQMLAAIRLTVAEGERLDQGPVAPCNNESGCICKGAVLIAAVPFDVVDAAVWQAVPATHTLLQPSPGMMLSSPADERCHDVVPISGRILRAYLASLVI
ncbi:MAG TPA: hypothetical protein VHZ24_06120 [Pirellulales bacterium]|jgi:hypothetical protein|nr:hypothetical protein [Pirellulales bacterium]